MLPAPHQPVILSIFAHPPDQEHLAQLEQERDQLQQILAPLPYLRHVDLPNAKSEQLVNMLSQYQEELLIFHFGGHADGTQVQLKDSSGRVEGLAETLGLHRQLKLVFLNGCNTQAQAQQYLAAGVPVVIATTCSVADGKARRFAEVFYQAFAQGYTLSEAFIRAKAALKLGEASVEGSEIVRWRGLELEGSSEAPWCLYLQATQAEDLQQWRLDTRSSRQDAVVAYYQRQVQRPPRGARFLGDYFPSAKEINSYKHYLLEGVLPYYSLDAFHAEQGTDPGLYSETYLLQELQGNPGIEGGIISGKGGIGKTRLMLQLGLMAHEEDWNVLVLNHSFNDEALLGAFLATQPRQKHLLLIDYLEECSWFGESWLEELRTHCRDVGDIKFLGNCRNSFVYPELDAWLDVQMDQHPAQEEYEYSVIAHILAGIYPLNSPDSTQDLFVKKPSFAVFLRYLEQRYPGQEQNILQFRDFKTWLVGRFIKTVDSERKSIEEFGAEIRWLLSFPLDEASKASYLRDGSVFKQTLNRLIKDGWVEESEGYYSNEWRVIQDTVLDELVLAYLGCFSDLQVELENTFGYAYGVQRARNWLMALQRIKNEALFSNKEGLFLAVIKIHLENKPSEEVELQYQLWRSPLLSLEEKLELAEQVPSFFEASIEDYDFVQVLTFFLRYVFTQGVGSIEKTQRWADTWINLHWPGENWGFQSARAARFISNYIRLFGVENIAGIVLDYLQRNAQKKETPFVLKAWLDTKINLDQVRPFVVAYLQHNAQKNDARFVLKAWLDAEGNSDQAYSFVNTYLQHNRNEKGTDFVIKAWIDANGDLDQVLPFLITYLQHNAQEKEAQFVLKAWLDAKGNLGQVLPFVIDYLQHNAQENEAQFVLKAWLDAKGNLGQVLPFVIIYLQYNVQKSDAQFVLRAWLEAKGDLDQALPFVITYLQHNAQKNEAQFVLKAWLDAKGNLEQIHPFVITYLQHNGRKDDAQFVLKAWLNAKGDLELINPFVITYLKQNPKEKGTTFVLKAWLDGKGNLDQVMPFVITYLEHNVQKDEAQFILKAWLNAKGDLELINPFVITYLQHNAQKNEAQFVLKAWLDAKGNLDQVLPFVITYLEHNVQKDEAPFVLKAWLDAKGNLDKVLPFIITYLEHNGQKDDAQFVLKAWLDAQGDLEQIHPFVITYLQHNGRKDDAQFVLKAWLNAKGDLEQIQSFVIAYLQQNPKEKGTTFVLKAWLDAKGNLDQVKPFVITYLEHNAQKDEAQFILKAWLNAKGDLEQINPFVITYLQHNALKNEAQFVLKAWLDAEGSLEQIQPFVLSHLQHNAHKNDARFVLKSWLKRALPYPPISQYLQTFLQSHATHSHLAELYQLGMHNPEYSAAVKPYIPDWISANLKNPEVVSVWVSWLLSYREEEQARQLAETLRSYYQRQGTMAVFEAQLPEVGSEERKVVDEVLGRA